MSKNQSAFKSLYSEMFNKGGDFNKVSKDLTKPLKCFVKESFPHFLLSDGYFFVPAYFTNEAVKEFRSKFGNVNISDLHDKVIILNDWHLEMKKVNSVEVFTSYQNLEARLIVSSFKPNLQEKLNPVRFPTNLYRDDEMKTTIQNFRHEAIQKSVAKNAKSDLPDISKFGEGKKAKIEEAGVVSIKGGKGDFSDFSFKEGSTNVARMQDIFTAEKGKDALKKFEATEHVSSSAPKARGGAKGKKKGAAKAKSAGKKTTEEAAEVKKHVGKVLKYTPSKSAGKKETPRRRARPAQRLQSERRLCPPCHPQAARSPPRPLTR